MQVKYDNSSHCGDALISMGDYDEYKGVNGVMHFHKTYEDAMKRQATVYQSRNYSAPKLTTYSTRLKLLYLSSKMY